MTANDWLERGESFPFDDPDAAWNESVPFSPSRSRHHRAARGVIAYVCDLMSVGLDLDIDEDVRRTIVETVAAIIAAAEPDASTNASAHGNDDGAPTSS
jgi:hypothetical protein